MDPLNSLKILNPITTEITERPEPSTPPPQLFSDKKNSDRYWEALLQAANGNKEAATALVTSESTDSYNWKKERPDNIESFFDKLLLTDMFRDPNTLSYLGLFESIGVRDHNQFLTDVSIKAARENLENAKNSLKILQTYSPETMTQEQRVSYKVFLWKLQHEIEGEKFLFHDYPVNQLYGTLQIISSLFTRYHKLEISEDVENYILRLGKIPEILEQTVEFMKYQKTLGIVPPYFALQKVLKMIQKITHYPYDENIFYTHLVDKMKEFYISDQDYRLGKVGNVIMKKVIPEYNMLGDYCVLLMREMEKEDGVWALPDGLAYYAHKLKEHTTTDLTPEEIHKLGLKEVDRIQTEMRRLLSEVGIEDDKKGVGALVKQMSKDDRFYYDNTDAGRKECLQGFKDILKRSREELWPLFDINLQTPVEIEPVPKHLEEGSPAAYYEPPNLDGSRPGRFCANLRDMKEVPKYGMETLVIHEAEPGHHFQFSLQNEMNIPVLRKLGCFTAYVEGWALYTEKLAYEKGFYTTPYDQLGHFLDELLRAVRLVVDTGIHCQGWTREEAIRYMESATGFVHDSVVTEVERYFVLPGQACAYKIGQLKILQLRETAMEKLGDKFDIREFHNVVLNVGAVPLDVLEDEVNEYIERTAY